MTSPFYLNIVFLGDDVFCFFTLFNHVSTNRRYAKHDEVFKNLLHWFPCPSRPRKPVKSFTERLLPKISKNTDVDLANFTVIWM